MFDGGKPYYTQFFRPEKPRSTSRTKNAFKWLGNDERPAPAVLLADRRRRQFGAYLLEQLPD
jgi:hypothetical protein